MATYLEKVDVILKLNNGSTSTGAIKTVNVKIGGTQKIEATTYNANLETNRGKALTLGLAIEACLAKTVYETQEVLTSQITN